MDWNKQHSREKAQLPPESRIPRWHAWGSGALQPVAAVYSRHFAERCRSPWAHCSRCPRSWLEVNPHLPSHSLCLLNVSTTVSIRNTIILITTPRCFANRFFRTADSKDPIHWSFYVIACTLHSDILTVLKAIDTLPFSLLCSLCFNNVVYGIFIKTGQ